MNDVCLSPNNIYIGKEEINCIKDFLSISTEELNNLIISKNLVFYFNIEYHGLSREIYNLYFDIPPHITHELVILYKKKNKYYTMVFSKDKYPPEFSNLNIGQKYTNMLPYGFINHNEDILLPIYSLCLKNNIYSTQHLDLIKTILTDSKIINISLPLEIINLIFSFFVKNKFDINKNYFYVTDRIHIGNNIFITEYKHLYKKKLILAIKV